MKFFIYILIAFFFGIVLSSGDHIPVKKCSPVKSPFTFTITNVVTSEYPFYVSKYYARSLLPVLTITQTNTFASTVVDSIYLSSYASVSTIAIPVKFSTPVYSTKNQIYTSTRYFNTTIDVSLDAVSTVYSIKNCALTSIVTLVSANYVTLHTTIPSTYLETSTSVYTLQQTTFLVNRFTSTISKYYKVKDIRTITQTVKSITHDVSITSSTTTVYKKDCPFYQSIKYFW